MQNLFLILMTSMWMKTIIATSEYGQDNNKSLSQEISLTDDEETEESFIEFLIMNSDEVKKNWANSNHLLTAPKCFDSALAAYSQETCYVVMGSICTMYKCTEQVKRKLHVGCQTLNNSFRKQSPNSLMMKLDLLKKGGVYKFIGRLQRFLNDSHKEVATSDSTTEPHLVKTIGRLKPIIEDDIDEEASMRTFNNSTELPLGKPIGDRHSGNIILRPNPVVHTHPIFRPIDRTEGKDRLVSQVGKLVEKVGYLVDEVETLVSEVQHAEAKRDKTQKFK